jgi:hypothetical protein
MSDYDTRIGRYGCNYHNGYWEVIYDGTQYFYLKTPEKMKEYRGSSRSTGGTGMLRGIWFYLDATDPHVETDF